MKGKFIKKLTACALAVAMIATTPMTASAAEFKDFYYWSKGEDTETETDTTTVSATNTGSSTTVLKDNATNIRGIKISPASLVMNVREKEVLKAEVLYANDSDTSAEAKAEINKRIHWETSDSKIATVSAKKNSMELCTITAKAAGFVKITASFDIDGDGEADYLSVANVTVKRSITKDSKLSLNFGDQEFYAGHTYDLKKFATIDGDKVLATDDVAFTMEFVTEKKDAKKTAVSADGILTVDKGIKNTVTVKVAATYSDNTVTIKSEAKEINLELGAPVSKVSADKLSKKAIDLKDNYNTTAPYTKKAIEDQEGFDTAKVTVTTKEGGTTTDDVVWASSNEKVAKVEVTQDISVDGKTTTAKIVGVSVGSAKITATFTSGKKASWNVKVTATLLAIEEVSVPATTWSGKTTPVTIKRVPAENTDKLVVTVSNKKVAKVKNYNIIPVTDLTKVADADRKIKVTVSDKNKKSSVAPCTSNDIIVKQSDVTFTGIARTTNGTNIEKATERLNPSSKTLTYYATGVTHAPVMTDAEAREAISWESAKETVATVNNGKLKVVGEGSAKITVSAVGKVKGKYKQIKKTFTVKSTPQCTDIVLKSNTAAGMVGAKVTLNVKQQLPKKAADAITWYVDTNGNGYTKVTDTKNATDKKLVYTIPTGTKSEIKVLATTGSVSTEATIYVIPSQTKKVNIVDESIKKGKSLKIGDFWVIDDKIVKVEPKSGTEAEPIVRYDVDKNGASVVKVVKLGNIGIVCGIGEGKATISAVTASGKSGKIKVTVSK